VSDGDISARVRAIVAARLADTSDESYNAFMNASAALRADAPAAIGAARDVFATGTAEERDAAADLVCRMAFDAPSEIHDAIYDCLVDFLATEQAGTHDESVIAAIVFAFGHVSDERAVPTLVQLATHDSAQVRHAVASSLPGATNYAETAPSAVVDALVQLSSDDDSDVRDWATFSLGQFRVDTPEVRAALVRCMTDSDEDTRAEAFMALAQLRDERVVEPLLAELAKDEVGRLDVEAAGEFGDERFLARLLEIAEWWEDDNGDRAILDEAIRRCTPRP
jgi:HEAT repeat protein